MALTLDDVLSAPQDPELLQRHLQKIGVLPPPAPQPQLGIGTITSSGQPSGVAVQPMQPVATAQPKKISLAPLSSPNAPPPSKAGEPVAPDLAAPAASPDAANALRIAPMQPPKITPKESIAAGMELHGTDAHEEGKRQYQEMRPEITAAPGTSQHEEQTLAQMQYDKQHPWGGEISPHPGAIGKIGHVLAKVGNIAGDIVAPATMANIPGTELNKQVQERGEQELLGTERAAESEEPLRAAQTKELEARAAKEGEGAPEIIEDAAGNAVGWRDEKGMPHSLEEESTPQVFKDMADVWQGKAAAKQPHENLEQGLAGAVADALAKGTKPSDDPAVKAWGDELQKYKPSKTADVKTAEDLKQRIAVAVEKGDADTVKQLQSELEATDPEGMARLRESQMRAAESAENARTSRETRKEKEDETLVRAYDKNGNEFLMPKGQADEQGLTHLSKATPKELDDAKQNSAALNDMGAKIKNLSGSLKALDQNAYQKTLIQTALKGHPDDYSTRAATALMSDQSKEYVQDVHSLREAALALPKQTTGGSRVSEVQAQALWNTVPATGGDSKYGTSQLKKFDENLTRLWKKVPQVEGQNRERAFEETKGEGGGGGAPAGKTPVYSPDGTPHYVNSDKVDKFLKDPKYKGWSKNAPAA